MAKQIIEILKSKVKTHATNTAIRNIEILRNIIKEEIQYYTLNFIYHHPQYSKWTMYGGSALRICYGLNRLSVDLDFEIDHTCTQTFLNKLKKEIELYFADKHEIEADMLTTKVVNGRGLLLRFSIGDELGINHHSKQVHVKIDLNSFTPPKIISERIPINRNQLSFVIKTYNMPILMASKIAAILLRGVRRVGKFSYEEKGRDIYDLLWYMEQKIVPDLRYLQARMKNNSVTNLRILFENLTLQLDKVSNQNLQHDLCPLFLDQEYIKNWIEQWHESYLRLVKSYAICTVTQLQGISVRQEFNNDNYSFTYVYGTEEKYSAKIIYTISDYWIEDLEGELTIKIDDDLTSLMHATAKRKTRADRLKQYATLFWQKNSAYLKKVDNVVSDLLQTKIICLEPHIIDPGKITLSRTQLLECELEDLLK